MTEQDDEIDLLELFMELMKHIPVIVLATIIGAVLMFSYSKLMITPQYVSTSKLYILTKSTSITSLADIQVGTQLSNDYAELITSRTILEKVIDEVGLDVTYSELLSKVTVSNPNNTRIINITVKDADPYLAKDIADALADISAESISEITSTEKPTVYEHGYVADRKSSPSNTKNGMIGAVIGFMIPCAIYVVLFLLDDSIKTPDDLEKYIGLNTLASIPLREGEKKTKRGIKSIRRV